MSQQAHATQNISARIIPFECDERDWGLLLEYFRLRHRVFVDRMAWDLNDFDGYELDAYDNETAFYAIVQNTETGYVVGGARLSPTKDPSHRSVGPNDASFMIADAFDGLLDSIPQDICFDAPPIAAHVWELTRVAVETGNVSDILLKSANDFLFARGISTCVALGSPAIMRVARKLGYKPEPIGPIVSNKDGRFLAFTCNVINNQPVAH